MKTYATEDIRNVAFVSHARAGKTSLVEALLYDVGATERLGRVEDGNTVSDYDSQEVARGISIMASLCTAEHGGKKLNILDTPGYVDFVAEQINCLRAVDLAVVVLDATSGVEVGTETAWKTAEKYNVPRMVVVNKLDKENANFEATVQSVRERFGARPVPIHLPIGSEASFRGFVDLLKMKAYIAEGEGPEREADIPEEMNDAVASAREAVIEAAAESDDALLEAYLEGEELSDEQIVTGLRQAMIQGACVPVLCASATKNIGALALADTLVALGPPPSSGPVAGKKPGTEEEVELPATAEGSFSALVFKILVDPYVGRICLFRIYSGRARSDMTVLNSTKSSKTKIGQLVALCGKPPGQALDSAVAGDIVAAPKLDADVGDTLCDPSKPIVYEPAELPEPIFSASVKPKSREDEEKMSTGLARIAEADPAFRFFRDADTEETIISGMGQLHLEIALARLKDSYGVDVEMGRPKIPYRETIRKTVTVHHRYKKQTGGRGQFGDVHLRLEPLQRGEGFKFLDEIVGGVIPKQYIPGVEKGVREAMQHGVLAGFPVVDVCVAVFDGQYHSVDSSELAFKIASAMAFRKGMEQADPVLLEPIVQADVVVPEECMGDVISDLNGKRGRILGMDSDRGMQTIHALVPLAEMATYGSELRSLTGGRGSYTMRHSHYEEVPPHLAEAIIAEHKRQQEEEG